MVPSTRRRFLASGLAASVGSTAGCVNAVTSRLLPGTDLSGPLAAAAPVLPASTVSFHTAFAAHGANTEYEGPEQDERTYCNPFLASILRRWFALDPVDAHGLTTARLADGTTVAVASGNFDREATVERVLDLPGDRLERVERRNGFEVLDGDHASLAVGESALVRADSLDPLLAAAAGERDRLLRPGADVTRTIDDLTVHDSLAWRAVPEGLDGSRDAPVYEELGVDWMLQTVPGGGFGRRAFSFAGRPDGDAVSALEDRESALANGSGRVTRRDASLVVYDVVREPAMAPQFAFDVEQRDGEPREGSVTLEFVVTAEGAMDPNQGRVAVVPAPDEAGRGYDVEVTADIETGARFAVAYDRGTSVESGDVVSVGWCPHWGTTTVAVQYGDHTIY